MIRRVRWFVLGCMLLDVGGGVLYLHMNFALPFWIVVLLGRVMTLLVTFAMLAGGVIYLARALFGDRKRPD